MDRIRVLRGELRRALHGQAWHGPALMEALRDATAQEAAARPVPGAHTVAEIALHALAWTEEVTRRLDGSAASLPLRGDWPDAGEVDEARWTEIRAELERAGAALDAAVAALPEERLDERVGGAERDAPLGSGVPFGVMLHGLAQHHAYHGGQVAVLLRAARGG